MRFAPNLHRCQGRTANKTLLRPQQQSLLCNGHTRPPPTPLCTFPRHRQRRSRSAHQGPCSPARTRSSCEQMWSPNPWDMMSMRPPLRCPCIDHLGRQHKRSSLRRYTPFRTSASKFSTHSAAPHEACPTRAQTVRTPLQMCHAHLHSRAFRLAGSPSPLRV